MPTFDRRRRSLLFSLLAIPLSACTSSPAVLKVEPRPLTSSDDPGPGGIAVFLMPGLNLSDVLVAVNEGVMPNVAAMLEMGLLIEDLRGPEGIMYTPEEVGRELITPWAYDALLASCLSWDVGLKEEEQASCRDLSGATLSLPELGQAVLDKIGESKEQERYQLLAVDDNLLTLQAEKLLVDARQPGFTENASLSFLHNWREALGSLDAALELVLEELDLTIWGVMLVSNCGAGAVFAGLDPTQVTGSSRSILAGGAMMEVSEGATWPQEEPWNSLLAGYAPGSNTRRRIIAPGGYAFLPPGAEMPRATPRPGGFILGVGRGLASGVRLGAFVPPRAGQFIAYLANGGSLVVSSMA